MTSPDEHTPPEPTTGDTAHLVARGILSVIPGAAELFEYLVSPPLQKRLDDWRNVVGETLRELSENHGMDLEELQANDAFIDTVLQASQIAARTSQEEKRRALRNAILNAALPDPPEQSLEQMFLSWIDHFTVRHLKLLYYIEENERRFNKRDFLSSYETELVYHFYPDPDEARLSVHQVWRELYQRGLVSVDSPWGNPDFDSRVILQSHSLVTLLGQEFLKFIRKP